MAHVHLLSVFTGEEFVPLAAFSSDDEAREAKRQHLADEPFRSVSEYRIQRVEFHKT